MVSSRSSDRQESWTQSVLRAQALNPEKNVPLGALLEGTSGAHQWVETTHPRPTFCNYCREKLSGVPWHGYNCEICKMKAHRKCTNKLTDKCKWTVAASIPKHLQHISPENTIVPHQWIEGNLPMPAKCIVCEKQCGAVRKLQDWRCLWCTICVHSDCLSQLGRGCSLGPASVSVIPPLLMKGVTDTGIARIRSDAHSRDFGGSSPLIVLINSKSGDNQGQRIIKKFRRLLNPCQVFDIITTGPDFALTFFSQFESFRVLVCGGDGTVGWVLSAFDRLNLHAKCQLGILPLGTGNDLARVLGWGHAFYDDNQLPQLVRTLERAHGKMLDRWSVLSIEGPHADAVRRYEEIVIEKVKAVLDAEKPDDVKATVTSLCTTVEDLMKNVSESYSNLDVWQKLDGKEDFDPMEEQCSVLLKKIKQLLNCLRHESGQVDESGMEQGYDDDSSATGDESRKGDTILTRSQSLKRALRDVITSAERGVDQHYRDSAYSKREKFRRKRSKTTPSNLRVSNSNLSSSSACSQPCSPAPDSTSNLEKDKTNLSADEQVGKERSESCKEGGDMEPSSSTTALLTTLMASEKEKKDGKGDNPSIGKVHPPTPGGTREPSAAFEDEKEKEKAQTDRPRVNSDSKLAKEKSINSYCSVSTKTTSTADYRLRPDSGDKIKISHSDSSLYEHIEESSSGTGGAVSRSTLSPGRAAADSSSTWSRSKDRKRELAMSTSSHLRSCRNMLSGFAGGSLIAEILLLNARVFSQQGSGCLTPFDQYKETRVMNNYFGIGLDAKIALDFHNKREESEKTKSRSKLFMWYGILGGKEFIHKTYKNLHKKIRLECDGVPIDLPSLQGIVILNIPSYSGGANFWGRKKDDGFTVQSFDDRTLEVVALFGVIHVATSRVPNVVRLQNHRIAQCRHVRIVILGDEAIPVQVDGEPWLQEPGIMQIVHKNRAQMLVKNPEFDATLKRWEQQKERSSTTGPSTPTTVYPIENAPFVRRAGEFLRLCESELAQLGVSSAFLGALDEASTMVRAGGTSDEDEIVGDLEDREDVLAAVERVVELVEDHFGWAERTKLPYGHPRLGPAPHFSFEIHGDDPESWKYVINSVRQEMDSEEVALRDMRQQELLGNRKSRRNQIRDWFSKKFGRKSSQPSNDNAPMWSVDEVCYWLSSIGLSEYTSEFKTNDIQGNELIHLERSDILELGITKIGHVKRIQSAIEELRQREMEKKRILARKNSKRSQVTLRSEEGKSGGPSGSRMVKSTSLQARISIGTADVSTTDPDPISSPKKDLEHPSVYSI